MNDEEYGVKLSMDLSDFKKGTQEAKKDLKDLETPRKIKVTGVDGDYTFTLRQGLEKTKEAFENLASVKDRLSSGDIKITGLMDDVDFTKIDNEYNKTLEKINNEYAMQPKFDNSILNQGVENAKTKVSEISYTLQDRMDAVSDNIKASLSNAVGSLSFKNVANEINNSLEGTVQNIKAKLSDAFSMENIKSKFSSAINNIKSKLLGLNKNASKTGNTLKNAFDKGVSSLKKYAMALFGAQTAYRAVTRAVNAYLQYDQQLSDSVQSTWAGLGSFFAPILEYLVGAFQKLLGYINAVVTALTGINFVARANAKAMANAGKSAKGAGKQAQKALAPFDELNNINQDTGSGGGGGTETPQINLPEVDQGFVDKILNGIQKVKDLMNTIFDPIQKAWEKKGPAFLNSVEYAFTQLINLGRDVGNSILEVWTNGTGQTIVENQLQLWTDIFNIIGNISKALDDAWNKNNNGTQIIQSIANIFISIQKFALSISDTLKKWTASPEFQKALEVIFGIIKDILKAIENIANWIVKMWNEYVKPILDEKVMPLVGSIADLIQAIWNNALKPLVDKIVTIVKPIIETVIKVVTRNIGNVMDILKSVADFLTGVFSGDWKKVFNSIKDIVSKTLKAVKDTFKGVFEGIWSIVKGILNFIIMGFENMVNNVINGLNSMIKPLTKVGNTILKAVGIKNFSFSVIPRVRLPRLAIGTDNVYEDGLAYLHKGEKVVPAEVAKGGYSGSDNEETNALLRQLIDAVNDKDYNPYITVDDIGKASVNYIRKKSRIEGEAIL